MKKLLITAIATAGMAFGLRADDAGFLSGTCFEGDNAGAYTAALPLWTTVEDANRTLTIDDSGYTYGGDHPVKWETATDTNFLNVKTTFGKPLVMNVVKDSAAAAQEIGAGLYFDSLVKFTVCDEAPAADGYDGAKVMVWLQETPEGNATNFYVRAGKYTTGWAANDYKCAVINNFDADAWHRLTIKAIKDIYEAEKEGDYTPGFVVFVDGEALVCTEESGIVEADLNGSAAEFFDKSQLFASMVQGEVMAKNSITSVGFDGQGAIDELAFTTTAPDFAVDPAARIAEVGDTVCHSVEEINAAIAAATGATTVKLLRKVTGDLTFGVGQAFTLDLNGLTLDGGVTVGALTVSGASLTITGDGVIEGAVTPVRCSIVLDSGKISVAKNENPLFVAKEGYELKKVNGYYVVSEITEDGTTEKPWQISTVADLAKFATHAADPVANQNFKLMNNIDFEGATWTPIGAGANKDNASWKDTERENPVGGAEGIANRVSTYKSTAFKGTFDGQGYTISNVVLPRQDYTGVFGSTFGATIKNLKVSCSGFEAGSTDCGGAIIAGTTVDTTIENCEVSGTVTATKGLAGIVGYAGSGTTIKGCVNKANLTTANEKIGGMIACAQNGGNDMDGMCVWGSNGVVVDGCTNEGNLSCTTSSKTYTAGLVSYADSVVTLKGANIVKGTLTQNGGSVSSIAAPNSGSIVLDGATFTVPAAYKTTVKNGKAVDGMIFATVKDGVATCVANSAAVAGANLKVMAPGAPTITLANIGDTITLDTSLATATVTTSAQNATVEATGLGQPIIYTVVKTSTPVEPGKDTEVEAKDAEEAASKVEITVSDDLAEVVADTNAYKALFKKVATPVAGQDGKFTVSIEFDQTVQAVKDIQTAVDTATKAIDVAAVATEAGTAEIANSVPGVYYVMQSADELGAIKPTDVKLGDGDKVELAVPTYTGSGFYRIDVSAKPVEIEK